MVFTHAVTVSQKIRIFQLCSFSGIIFLHRFSVEGYCALSVSALAEEGSCLCGTPVTSVTKAVLFSRTVERSSGLWRGMQQWDMESNGKPVTMGGSEAPVASRS